MNIIQKLLFSCLISFLLTTTNAQAVVTGEMVMVRSSEAFPETMALLQEAIRNQGYELSRIQRIDVGLSAKGYETDKYRVVFFGKGKQIQELSLKYPQLIPYLPLKIAIFAEGENTILISANPTTYNDLFKLPELKPTFEKWLEDITQILKSVQIQN
ncbi:MAG: DUF302 domain-containing protein [endosymbiont of Galathealinum brachiosum]|uniref:DUF302 domain-containing protein n=1 Tax=endosymbiont of Galathealinum brachiosum TaxID=2200906 RepID=A0A370DCY8_9GAMM|nr:MAG: DUF302 domain-containing protein [endosymbiont of Galathealinum brachiosum]